MPSIDCLLASPAVESLTPDPVFLFRRNVTNKVEYTIDCASIFLHARKNTQARLHMHQTLHLHIRRDLLQQFSMLVILSSVINLAAEKQRTTNSQISDPSCQYPRNTISQNRSDCLISSLSQIIISALSDSCPIT